MKESILFIKQTIALMNYYSFDLEEYTTKDLIVKWSKKYPHFWLPLAVLEAIYQGRLKAISVEHILQLWHRHGNPNYQFNQDFEQLVSHNVYVDCEQLIDLDEDLNNHKPLKESDCEQKKTQNSCSLVKEKSSIQNFQPVEDYSLCFSQLKSLAKLPNLSEIDQEE